MATNPFFRNYDFRNEQSVIDDLVVESIQITGVDLYYLPRLLIEEKSVFNEDKLSIFNTALPIEMYLKSYDAFQGEGDFLSKFGLQIRDQIVFSVAVSTYKKLVSRYTDSPRPMEGDLIYFPLSKKLYEVTFNEHEAVFYQNGELYSYDVRCELFEYSNERFATGIEEIDTMYNSYNTDGVSDLTELEDIDPISKNLQYETESNDIIDFSEIDPFTTEITDITDD